MSEMEDVLLDVRRAYRLVWAYQRRMMDLIQIIADGFDTHEFYAWSPVGSDRPTQLTSNPLKKWAWDTLPFYKPSFLFKIAGSDANHLKAGDWLLEIHLLTDDFDRSAIRGEPDALRMSDVTSTSSTLKLIGWKCTEDVSTNWFHNVWWNSDWPESDDAPYHVSGFPILSTSLSVPLSSLPNRVAANELTSRFKFKLKKDLDIKF